MSNEKLVTVSKAEIKLYDSFFYPEVLCCDLSIVWLLSSPLGGVRHSIDFQSNRQTQPTICHSKS